MISQIQHHIADGLGAQTYRLLVRSNLLRERDANSGLPALTIWPREDRVVLILDPLRVKNADAIASERFKHHLATTLQGRRIVVTNHRGLFIQVAYWPPPHRELTSQSLDLSRQPSSLYVPIGMTVNKPDGWWLSLAEMDAVLIGGARRMGKTNLLHGWITALLQGGETGLLLFDGKRGVEFARYANNSRAQVVEKLGDALGEVFAEMDVRFTLLEKTGATNLAEYNAGRGNGERLERSVLVVDELAFALQERAVEDALVDLIARGGAVGIHPILATQRPSSDVVTPRLKGNLSTRIALPVPDRASSMVILDCAGAEKMDKIPGRLLITRNARLVQAHAFDSRVVASSNSLLVEERHPNNATTRPRDYLTTRLTDRELRIARAVIERLEGLFTTEGVMRETEERSVKYINALAHRWHAMGYLSQVLRHERGYNLGRQALPRLRQVLTGESGQVGNEENPGNRGNEDLK